MWYDDPFVKFKKKKKNRRRRTARDPILMVNARTAEVRRERLHRIGALVICLAAIAALGWLLVSGGRFVGRCLFVENPRYSVLNFEAGSDGTRINARRIREFAELGETFNLFAISLKTVRTRLEEVPVIKTARIQRILPDTLKIWVTERVAIARLAGKRNAQSWAIDRDGYVLGPGTRYAGLPLIFGADMSNLRPRKKRESPQIASAINVLEIVAASQPLSRVLNIESIEIEDGIDLQLFLDENRIGMITRENSEKQLGDLAVTIQQADSAGKKWKTFDCRVEKNQFVK
jgi:cell division septal protein FtsQ